MKKVSVIGVGRLGLCFALTLERGGYNVLGCDINESYVNALNNKVFTSTEPNLNEFFHEATNFKATVDYPQTVAHGDIIFVLVHTETEKNGKYDHSHVESVLSSLQQLGPQEVQKHLVICSNINPGYSNEIAERLRPLNWAVSYNPEMVAQGTILQNQAFPDCVYIGTESEKLGNDLKEVYDNICLNSPQVFVMDRLSAELTKVSINCFLTVKISFANMVGDLAVKMKANPAKVLEAAGADSRINHKFFRYGFGWGGPCFPRDTRAFMRNAEDQGVNAFLVKAADAMNQEHLSFQVEQFLLQHDKEDPIIFDASGECISDGIIFEGVAYKKGTTIIEESQQLAFAAAVAENGYDVTVIDLPETITQVKATYGNVFNYEEISE